MGVLAQAHVVPALPALAVRKRSGAACAGSGVIPRGSSQARGRLPFQRVLVPSLPPRSVLPSGTAGSAAAAVALRALGHGEAPGPVVTAPGCCVITGAGRHAGLGQKAVFYVTLAGRQGRWRLARCSWPRPAPRTPPSLIRAAEPRLRATERSVSPASLRHRPRPRWHLPGKSVCRAPGRGCSSSSSTQSGTGGGGRGLGGPGGSPARGAVSGVEWNEAPSVRGGSGGALAGSVLLCCTVHVSVTNLLVRPEL